MATKNVSIDTIVNKYIEVGNLCGYFQAEMILMKYLPENKPDGKCKDVPAKSRKAFLNELQETINGGLKVSIKRVK